MIRATGQAGLADRLETIQVLNIFCNLSTGELQGKLSLCEKALAEYLETKRLAFPRFYFVSSADLLDILSNGNQVDGFLIQISYLCPIQPLLVGKHFVKLFDSLARIEMVEGKEGQTTNLAERMFAKDGEEVVFPEPCLCEGKVIRKNLEKNGL